MYAHQYHAVTFSDLLQTLWRYRTRCIVTALIVLGLAAAYAIAGPRTWVGSQAVIVRDDAATQFSAIGRMRSDEEIKNTQETLQEILQSCSLLKSVLRQVGPPASDVSTGPWPSDEAVAALRSAVSLAPPKGVEFGKSTVFYLKVKDRDRDRAVQLTEALYTELGRVLGELRATMAQSTITELQESVALTETNLTQATHRLAEIEKEVGVDLVALRVLNQSPTGDASVFRSLTGGLEELRATRAKETQYATMLNMLNEAKSNPTLLLAAPKELLECHPGLDRLIQGLSESRLRSFAEASKLTPEHPIMRAAIREESGIREGIRQELGVAIEGVSAAQKLAAARRKALEIQVDDLNQRLHRLTNVRAEYANLVAQVEQRRTLVEESHRNLAQARAACAAATTSSLLNRVDVPDGGLRPVGASRAMIGLGGLLGGLVAGCGMVFLTAPISRRKEPAPDLPFAASMAQPMSRHTGVDRVVRARVREAVMAGENEI